MNAKSGTGSYRAIDSALLRASAHLADVVPAWWPAEKDDTESQSAERWCAWLREAWERDGVADAVRTASPALAEQVSAACGGAPSDVVRVRRLALALARYLVRMRGRATPFGLFAGVTPVRFGQMVQVGWSDRHRLRVRPDAAWLDTTLRLLESDPEVRRHLTVVRNDLAMVRGDRLLVPLGGETNGGGRGELSLHHSAAVRLVLELTAAPVPVPVLVDKLVAASSAGDDPTAEAMLATLIRARVLITSLRPGSTIVDPLTYVLDRLSGITADDALAVAALAELRKIRVRAREATDRPSVSVASRAASWAVDLGMDADLVLPEVVAREAQTAVGALLRLSPSRHGHPGWRAYHSRFLDRFGVGAAVAVEHLVDPTIGLGFPEHFGPASGRTTGEEPRMVTRRDDILLQLAHQAAWTGAHEVVLDDALLDELDPTPDRPVRDAPHLDVCVELRARTRDAVQAGEFTLAVVGIGRTGLATSGRFLDLLPERDAHRMTAALRALPTTVGGAAAVQLSFPPLSPRTENVARVQPVLPEVLSLGEHPRCGAGGVGDLVVTADHGGMYLISRSRGVVIEPTLAHALARHAMAPLVRFLAELPRATSSSVALFDWGVADRLPFRPRLRYGRAVLAGARWRLDPRLLPDPSATRAVWRAGLDAVREQLRLPAVVAVGTGDRRLRLHLNDVMDADLLREHIARAPGPVTVAEASTSADHGWIDGRAHEILIPMFRATPPVPAPAIFDGDRSMVLIGREHGLLPGAGVLSARLSCHPNDMDTILARFLPELLAEEPPAMRWWFLRVHGPDPYVRLRWHTDRYGVTAERLGDWASMLRRRGLAGSLALDTYRSELARYTLDGDQNAMNAAETVFAADSAAARAQLLATTSDGAHPVALAAASIVDLTCALAGGRRTAARWLVRRGDLSAHARIRDRRLADQVRTLAGPGRAGLLGPHGDDVALAWEARRQAVHGYRAALQPDVPYGVATVPRDSIVVSLLHLHHVRCLGSDPSREALCHRLARSVALAALVNDPSAEDLA